MRGRAAAYDELVLGGVATICPECSYEWTISPAVSISWPCPKCGGSRCVQTDGNPCVCGHVYGEHHTFEKVPPSRTAFGVRITELDMLADLLATEPAPPPKLGDCTACNCERFELKPPTLSAAGVSASDLSSIHSRSRRERGAGARAARRLTPHIQGRSLRLAAGAAGGMRRHTLTIRRTARCRACLPMDGASVGATVIALRGYLAGVQRAI